MATDPVTGYIGLAVETDAEEIADEAFDYLQTQLPGWEPNEGNLEVILIEGQAQEQAIERDLASQTTDDIFRAFGAVAGIPPTEAAPARGTTTWTMADNAGYTVDEGTQVTVVGPDGEEVGFQTLDAFTVPNGSTVATNVTIEAIEPGAETSGLAGPVTLIDALTFVASVVLVGVTTGGKDEEANSAYLARLARRLQLQSTAVTLPRDAEILALDVGGVARALAVDLYEPHHNLLTANQSSVEVDTTGFAVGANSTIARSTAQAAHGTASLQVTAVAGGGTPATASTLTGVNGVPVTAGKLYTARAGIRAAVTPRSVQVGIAFYTAAGALIGVTIYGTAVTDTTSGFTVASRSTQAPATSAFAAVFFQVLNPAAAEVHYVDQIQLREDTQDVDWVIGPVSATQSRTFSVVAVDEAGQPLPQPAKDELDALLQAQRETNFNVYVEDPVYWAIPVTTTVKALPGYDTAYVQAAVTAQLTNYLSPANWGKPNVAEEVQWVNRKVVRYNEVLAEIDKADGVDYVVSLTVVGLTVDIPLGSIAPLTTPGLLTVTAQAAS